VFDEAVGTAPEVLLKAVSKRTMEALVTDDLVLASHQMGMDIPVEMLEAKWLFEMRIPQIENDPAAEFWLVRAIQRVSDGKVIGHAGFHAAPDEAGMVEMGYTVFEEYRRQGYGRATAQALIKESFQHPEVSTVRASISPDNLPSLKLLEPLGFTQTGEQWDDEDGLELVFELRREE
jgi:RimJ/RimL family protein N-acetyltransferase